MTESEEDQVLAGLVRERRTLGLKTTCLQEKIREAYIQPMNAGDLISPNRPHISTEETANYPDCGALNNLDVGTERRRSQAQGHQHEAERLALRANPAHGHFRI